MKFFKITCPSCYTKIGLLLFIIFTCLCPTYAQTIKAVADKPVPEIGWHHPYHQTLMMKLFLSDVGAEKGTKNQVKMRDKGESNVVLNFEQALEVIKKIDGLTLGIPKIIYLVGWQYNGHDSKYPAWDEVNRKLKRPQDETALGSMHWLMDEARKYNTTVSVHINMFDAYEDSPLWELYVENDIIARNEDGSLRGGEWGWPISYTQEWNTGYAQKRIDRICDMLKLEKAGTVHIDAFHTWAPFEPEGPISPYLGHSVEQETEAQRDIYRYWSSKGVDVTSEGVRFLRNTAFEGLQPAAWWFGVSPEEYMKWPASYYCGGNTNDAEGKLFGRSMHGEDIIKNDPEQLSQFLYQFCTQTLPWYYLNQLDRLEYIQNEKYREVRFSDGVTTRLAGDEYTMRKGKQLMVHNNNIFVPALWIDKPAIIAYSADGYQKKEWLLPSIWKDIKTVDIYKITTEGKTLLTSEQKLKNNKITLSLQKDEGVVIIGKP